MLLKPIALEFEMLSYTVITGIKSSKDLLMNMLS